MKKIIIAGTALILLISIYSFKAAEDKKQFVTITIYNEALSKTNFIIIDNGITKNLNCKQKEQIAERYNIINEYINNGYTISSSNNFAVMISNVYVQEETLYLVK